MTDAWKRIDDVPSVLFFDARVESARKFHSSISNTMNRKCNAQDPGLTLAALQCMVASGCLGRKDGISSMDAR
jgi:hypothetical protein